MIKRYDGGASLGGTRQAGACLCIVMCLLLVGALTSACSSKETLSPLLPPEEGPPTEPAIAPTVTPTTTPTDGPRETTIPPTEAPTVAPTDTPQPTPEPLADWARYANADYGFGFRFPPNWSIELLSDRQDNVAGNPIADAVRLSESEPSGAGTIEILIEFRNPEQAVTIGPGGLPDGEILDRGTVRLLDRILPKHVLVHEEKDKAVFVGERFVDLELYVQMREVGEDIGYSEIEISATAHETFDQILASVSRADGTEVADLYPQWETYISPSPERGFSFRYPAGWTLRETSDPPAAPTLVLTKETYLLTIQVKAAGSPDVLGPETTSEGLTMEAGAATFMQHLTPRNVLIHEDRLKMIFLTLQGDDLECYVALTEDPELVPYAEIDLSEAVRHEMDQILASFQPQE